MQTHFLFDVLDGYQPFEQIAEESRRESAVIAASGLAGAQKAHLACALAEKTGRPLLFLCDSERSAAQVMEDVSALLGGGSYLCQLVAAAALPATVVYPIVTGGSILLTVAAGWIFFRERVSGKMWIGIGLCVVGTGLFI